MISDSQNLSPQIETLHKLLKLAKDAKASDIHIKPGKAPVVRVNGQLLEVDGFEKMTSQDVNAFARDMMTPKQVEHFQNNFEVDLAYSVPGVGRFRSNIFRQRGSISIALRAISTEVKTIRELYLPAVIEKIANERRGLTLVTGATGSGKSTTLAAVVDYINTTRPAHIITIEDPIEYLIKDKKSIVAQREVGLDTKGFLSAIRGAMRQDPDVILVGELRDEETIKTALMAAETGHMVLGTLHTTDVMETIGRILSFFEGAQAQQIRDQLATSIKAIMCQRLIKRSDRPGRIPAVEIMIQTSHISELIKDARRTPEIRDAMAQGYSSYGMQTFDMSLMKLVMEKKVAYQEALENCSNPIDFSLKFKGVSSTGDTEMAEFHRKKPMAKGPAGAPPKKPAPAQRMSPGAPRPQQNSGADQGKEMVIERIEKK